MERLVAYSSPQATCLEVKVEVGGDVQLVHTTLRQPVSDVTIDDVIELMHKTPWHVP